MGGSSGEIRGWLWVKKRGEGEMSFALLSWERGRAVTMEEVAVAVASINHIIHFYSPYSPYSPS